MQRDDLAKKLGNLDKRIIYTIVFLVLLIPLLKPIGLPLVISREVKASYDTIEALPSGSIVLFSNGVTPTGEAENNPQSVAIIKHMVRKQLKIVLVPSVAQSTRYVETYASLCRSLGYKDGTDFVVLPFNAGGETVYAAMAQNFKSLYSQVASSPLWDSIKDVKSFGAMIECINGENWRWMLAHVEARHRIKCLALITAINASACQSFFSSGQLAGVVSGLNGAAEYELLAKVPGEAVAGMDAQSLGHLWIIILVILGNIGFVMSKKANAPEASAAGGGK